MKTLAKMLYALLIKRINRRHYNQQNFRGYNERPVEYGFVLAHMRDHVPEKVLDVGTGITALPSIMRTCGAVVTAIDNVHDYWTKGMVNPHFHIIHDDITASKLTAKFDLITCISTPEHITHYDMAVENMFQLLKPEGHLIITCPYNEQDYCADVYKEPTSSELKKKHPFVTQAFSRENVTHWLGTNGGILVEQQYWQFYTGRYWTEGERIQPPVSVEANHSHQITCLKLKKE